MKERRIKYLLVALAAAALMFAGVAVGWTRPPAKQTANQHSPALQSAAPVAQHGTPFQQSIARTPANKQPAEDPSTDSKREGGPREPKNIELAEKPVPFPPGALQDSLVLHFTSDESMLGFVKEAQSRGIVILGILGELRAVRIAMLGDVSDASTLDFARQHAAPVFEYPVFPPTPLPAEGISGDAGFGDTALDWLGVPHANVDWGKGVTIAVLDSPLAANALSDSKVDTIQSEVAGNNPEATDHGTAVSSLIVSRDPRSPGIAPAAQLLHVDVLGADHSGSTFAVAQGILEALDRGAQIISISLSTSGDSRVLREAIRLASVRGAVVVASAGNDSAQRIPYPAAYDSVIAVAAVDANGRRAAFSNTGPQVDISAPGVGMRVPAGKERFGTASGTSLASPLVSGMIAQVLSQDSTLTPRAAADVVLHYTNDAGLPGTDDVFGVGILNAQRILERETRGIRDAAIADHWVVADERGNLELVVTVQNRGTEPLSAVTLEVRAGNTARVFGIGSLSPGEVGTGRINLDGGSNSADWEMPVDSQVTAGADDAPANNSKRTVLRLR